MKRRFKKKDAVERLASNHGSGKGGIWPKSIGFCNEPMKEFFTRILPNPLPEPDDEGTVSDATRHAADHIDDNDFVVLMKMKGSGICLFEPRNHQVSIFSNVESEMTIQILNPLLVSEAPKKIVFDRRKTLGWFNGKLGDVRDVREMISMRTDQPEMRTLDFCTQGAFRQQFVEKVESTPPDSIATDLIEYVLFNLGRLYSTLEQEVLFLPNTMSLSLVRPTDLMPILASVSSAIAEDVRKNVPIPGTLKRIIIQPNLAPNYIIDSNCISQTLISDMKPLSVESVESFFETAGQAFPPELGITLKHVKGGSVELSIQTRAPNVAVMLQDISTSFLSLSQFSVAVVGEPMSGKSTVLRELAIDIISRSTPGFEVFVQSESTVFVFGVVEPGQVKQFFSLEEIPVDGSVPRHALIIFRSEEHKSELQSRQVISSAAFFLNKKINVNTELSY